jgi:hypothetical protein
MAKYRSLHVKLWTDPEFEAFPVSAKIIFLYLLTNANRTESGIYDISQAMIAFQCGLTRDDVAAGLGVLIDAGKVRYDAATSTVWIVNAVKHQALNANCVKSIAIDLRRCANEGIVTAFCEYYRDFEQLANICRGILGEPIEEIPPPNDEPIPNPSQTHCEGVGNPSNRVQGIGYRDSHTRSNTDSEEEERAHAREESPREATGQTVTRSMPFTDPSVVATRLPDGSVILNSGEIVDAILPRYHLPESMRAVIVAWIEIHGNQSPSQHDCRSLMRRCDDAGPEVVEVAIRRMGNDGFKPISKLDTYITQVRGERAKTARAAAMPRGDA